MATTCSGCKEELGPEDKFCGACGRRTEPPVPDETTSYSPAATHSNTADTSPEGPETRVLPAATSAVGISTKVVLLFWVKFSLLLLATTGLLQFLNIYSFFFNRFFADIEQEVYFDGRPHYGWSIDPLPVALVAVIAIYISCKLVGRKLRPVSFFWFFAILAAAKYAFNLMQLPLLIPFLGWHRKFVEIGSSQGPQFFELMYNELIFSTISAVGLMFALRHLMIGEKSPGK